MVIGGFCPRWQAIVQQAPRARPWTGSPRPSATQLCCTANRISNGATTASAASLLAHLLEVSSKRALLDLVASCSTFACRSFAEPRLRASTPALLTAPTFATLCHLKATSRRAQALAQLQMQCRRPN